MQIPAAFSKQFNTDHDWEFYTEQRVQNAAITEPGPHTQVGVTIARMPGTTGPATIEGSPVADLIWLLGTGLTVIVDGELEQKR